MVVDDLRGELGLAIDLVGDDGRDDVMEGMFDVRGKEDTLSPKRGFVAIVENPPGADPDADSEGERKVCACDCVCPALAERA